MLAVLVMLASLVLAVTIHRVLDNIRHHYAPGPVSFPILGSLHQLAFANSIMQTQIKKLSDKYGNVIFFRVFMNEPMLVVRGHDHIKEATHNRAFSGVGRTLSFREHGLHRRLGLIFSDGDNWHQMRRFSVRALHKQGFGRKSRSDNINQELAVVLEPMLEAAAAGLPISVAGLFTLASINSLLQLVANVKLSRGGEVEHLAELVSRTTRRVGPNSMLLDMFPWLRWVAPKFSGYQELSQEVHELINALRPIVAEHRAQLQTDQPPKSLVDDYLQQQQTNEASVFSDDNLHALLKDLLMAGMETTNVAMEWLILQLVIHPAVQSCAAAEVARVIGSERHPQIQDMPHMPYLQAVVEESLRWMPLLPVIQHATLFGATKIGGYYVPANCRILFDLYSVAHDKEFWGDPEQFRPERFLAKDAARLHERVTVFGFGLRRCIGETHARQLMFLFTAGLLQQLELRLCTGQEDTAVCDPGLVMRPRPFKISAHRRQ